MGPRRLAAACAAALLLSGCVQFVSISIGGGTSPAALETVEPTSSGFADMMNGLRTGNGRSAIPQSQALTAAARGHAEDMADAGFISHTGSDGSSVADRVRAQGIRGCLVAENITRAGSAAQAYQHWVGSPGHRRNMLRLATMYGLANNGDLWVLVLARPC